MAPFSDWRLLLRKVSLFSSFTQKELILLTKKMTLASYPKGAKLVEENQPGRTFYLIVSGTARLVKTNTGANSHTKQDTLAYVGRGDAVGEISLLTGEPYPYTATIESTAEVLILKKSDFDDLLGEYPTLSVHVSRMLSSHIASLTQKEKGPRAPSKLIALISAIPHRDQILFSVNLGIALVEHTRQKTLLVVIDEGTNLIPKSLKLEPEALTEDSIRSGVFEDPQKFDSLVMIHPSGLEVINVEKRIFFSLEKDVHLKFISLLKTHYDLCLINLPTEFNETFFTFIQEASNNVFISYPQSAPKDMDVLRQAEHALPLHKPKDRIWLETEAGNVPPNVPPGNRIPWDREWGRQFMLTGSPFIPFEAERTRRKIDRFARYLGGLLVGFAMGSGAAFGYSIIGMLRVMEREGIYPDLICGTSMGALIGSFYAAGKTPDELEVIARSITKKRLWQMASLSFPRSGFLTGRGILHFLRTHLGELNFKDLEIPFTCVATDIQSGREVILDDGNVAQAVRASLSLPVYFQPFYSSGRYLVDGGLVNPVPNSVILSQGANILISANLTSKASERKVRYLGWRRRIPTALRGPNILEILLKTIYTMQYEIAESRAKMAHVNMEITPKGEWWWDLDKAEQIIQLGEASAEENLPKIKSLLPYFADSCRIHLSRRRRKIY